MIARPADPPTNDPFTSLGGVAGADGLHRGFGLTETRTPSGTGGLTGAVPRGKVVALENGFAGSRCGGWRLNSDAEAWVRDVGRR